jgi:hypothetical protein
MMMMMIFGAIGGMNLAGETEVLGGNLSTTKSHMTRSRTPDRSGGNPATNRLSYGAAHHIQLLAYVGIVTRFDVFSAFY